MQGRQDTIVGIVPRIVEGLCPGDIFCLRNIQIGSGNCKPDINGYLGGGKVTTI